MKTIKRTRCVRCGELIKRTVWTFDIGRLSIAWKDKGYSTICDRCDRELTEQLRNKE